MTENAKAGLSVNRPAATATKGFTLIELLVVLALAAILLAVAPPMIARALPGVQLKSATEQIAAGLRYARNRALTTREASVLTLDVEKHLFSVTGKKKSTGFADNIELELFTAESEMVSETAGNIRFFPTGGSTGGRITLSNEKRKYEVDVDWLTGRVRILE